jgi:hypothetical protein
MPLLSWEILGWQPLASRDVGSVAVLDYPSGGAQKLVDVLASQVLGGDWHGKANYSQSSCW